ncbi:hypothetical protein GURASL_12360 [Geotalea uraniireducens]|uniref:Sensor histidine kinase n=1 Tax=Geotalea uraniireducens TaxID=351604 RepID=A0ABM8EIU9_9BACT|nr:hypothetical protein [Geotalea uraniireducens]BDV42313.1 hypothetical protein GURASL_12360 [Geotalea uraniireducens]
MTSAPILALFRSGADRDRWSPVLAALPAPCRTMHRLTGDDLTAGDAPRLAIVSAAAYAAAPHLSAALRSRHPAAELLLLAADGEQPPLHRLFDDRIRHLVINPDGGGAAHADELRLFRLAVEKLLRGESWQVGDYLQPGAAVFEFPLSCSCQKEEIIDRLERLIPDSADAGSLRQRAALLADELLENAMFGAPRDPNGTALFRKGTDRPIGPEEAIRFRFGLDDRTLAMEVEDGWGSLAPEEVLAHLAKNEARQLLEPTAGGRGLFIIWRFLDRLHVTITPGRQTVIGGQIRLGEPLTERPPRGFHISAH